MLTTTHALLGAATFGKPNQPARTIGGIAGGFLPDLPIFVLVAWALATGMPQSELWGQVYFAEPWHSIINVFNSAPIFLSLLLVGLWRQIDWLWTFAGAALLHCFTDFLTHHDDGHAHLWPFSEWIFASPVSYWDHNHFGREFFIFEIVVTVALSVVLFRRFKARWVRAIIGLSWIGGAAALAFFTLTLGGSN